ncbi:MAG: acylneuraminate cytidylyltransferase family protein [Pseudomonadota bacterium]
MNRLAIIPARGGSKRIPDKNIRAFCGRPMIAHTLDAARESRLVATIHVSTDSAAIAEVAAEHGYPPAFPRPAALADDHTPIMPVLRHAVERFAEGGAHFDEIWLLIACAPLTTAADLKGAATLYAASDGDRALLAVSEYPAPVEWAFRRDVDGGLAPLQPGAFAIRSQDLEKRYFDAGCFAVFPPSRVRASEGAGHDADFVGYVLPRGSSVDIDDEDDWALAEALYRARRRG